MIEPWQYQGWTKMKSSLTQFHMTPKVVSMYNVSCNNSVHVLLSLNGEWINPAMFVSYRMCNNPGKCVVELSRNVLANSD